MLNAKGVFFVWLQRTTCTYEFRYTCLNFKGQWRSGSKIKIFLVHRSEMIFSLCVFIVHHQSTNSFEPGVRQDYGIIQGFVDKASMTLVSSMKTTDNTCFVQNQATF